MPIAVVLRRLFLITLLFLPQRYWLGRAWRLGADLRSRAASRIVQAFLVLAAILTVSVLWDRIFRKFLPASIGSWIAPAVQLWIFTSTFAFFCMKAIHAVDWLWSKLAGAFFAASSHKPPNPARRSFLRQAASIVGGVPFVAAIYGYACGFGSSAIARRREVSFDCASGPCRTIGGQSASSHDNRFRLRFRVGAVNRSLSKRKAVTVPRACDWLSEVMQ
jgi:hypothetical protein